MAKKLDEDTEYKYSCAAERQLNGIKSSVKLASDALRADSYGEAKKWLTNAQVNLLEAQEILGELAGGKE